MYFCCKLVISQDDFVRKFSEVKHKKLRKRNSRSQHCNNFALTSINSTQTRCCQRKRGYYVIVVCSPKDGEENIYVAVFTARSSTKKKRKKNWPNQRYASGNGSLSRKKMRKVSQENGSYSTRKKKRCIVPIAVDSDLASVSFLLPARQLICL